METDSSPDDPYRTAAEFYDLFHGETYRRRAVGHLAASAAGSALGILEVGAGTGIVTEVLARSSTVPVHAVEPSRAMRTVLMARLSALEWLRGKVRVYPVAVQRARLDAPVDLATCVNVVATVAPEERPGLWSALAARLVPGGMLIVDAPGRLAPLPGHRDWRLPAVRVGDDDYTAAVRVRPAGADGRLRWTYQYAVRHGERTVREESASFYAWPLDPSRTAAELARAGFARAPGTAPVAAYAGGLAPFEHLAYYLRRRD
ncbi:class I SAM-dependent methyltransferase [Streptomyces sp. SAJ15]|uniref:class I SAM-dependent methyltransferase n=1 Tax=Streptomyces sp. SAJ15 TaxID=2011095 RepID=UPI001186DD3D|nr:class I SAM-dependent methyltransferase [Streptomyces sp. SAJ15]TVL93035.1 SAM-dependent methyltransferase [Streptomyces sp. SAJ15]